MKKNYSPFWFSCLIAGLLASCSDTKQENTTQLADTVSTVSPSATSSILSNYGPHLQAIIKSDQGVLRGINFGDDVEKVKAIEEGKIKEDSTDHLGYTVELGNYEDLDVRYHLNGQQKVWGFTMDIYLDKQSAVDSLLNDFKGYFAERFGPYNFDNHKNMVAWNLADTLKVVIKDVGIKQAPGLQVQIMDLKKADKQVSN